MVDRIERVTRRDRPSAGRQNRIAAAVNAMLGATAPHALRGSDGLHLRRAVTGAASNTILPVKNMSGGSATRFGVLGISAPLFVPGSDKTGFLNEWGFEGVTPTADHAGRIAVLLDDADPGQIVPAAVDGIVVVQVDMQSDADPRADVKAGDASKLASGGDGTARILWAEAGTGVKWALVNLAAGGAGGGGLTPMIVTAVESTYDFGFGGKLIRGDYLRCKEWDGSQGVGAEKWVLMPHELRVTPWHNETVGDLNYDYAADGNAFGVRDVTNVNTSETERQWITPPYVPNTSIIHAIASGEGVTDPDSSDPAEPTDLIDANLGARAWSGG